MHICTIIIVVLNTYLLHFNITQIFSVIYLTLYCYHGHHHRRCNCYSCCCLCCRKCRQYDSYYWYFSYFVSNLINITGVSCQHSIIIASILLVSNSFIINNIIITRAFLLWCCVLECQLMFTNNVHAGTCRCGIGSKQHCTAAATANRPGGLCNITLAEPGDPPLCTKLIVHYSVHSASPIISLYFLRAFCSWWAHGLIIWGTRAGVVRYTGWSGEVHWLVRWGTRAGAVKYTGWWGEYTGWWGEVQGLLWPAVGSSHASVLCKH